LAFILSSCLQMCSAYHSNNRNLHRAIDMRHASGATTIIVSIIKYGGTRCRPDLEKGLGQAQAGPCSHVVLHFIDTSADNGSDLRARPSNPVGWALVVSFSLDPRVETVRDRGESAQSVATEFAFVRILALKVAPILAGRSGSRQAHRFVSISAQQVRSSWVTSPSTALLEDFPPSTCAGGSACHHDSKTPEPEWDDSTPTSIS